MPKIQKHIHLFHDDKFVNNAIDVFESFDRNKYEYFVFIRNIDEKLKFADENRVKIVCFNDINDRRLFAEYVNNECKILYLHALDSLKRKFLTVVKPSITKVWFIWGFDLYNSWPVYDNEIYEPLTKSLYLSLKTKQGKLNKAKRSYFGYLLFLLGVRLPYFFHKKTPYRILSQTYLSYYRSVNSIDVVAPVIRAEMKILNRMKIYPTYAPFRYIYLEMIFGENYKELPMVSGSDILVGNSAALSSNHLDVFVKLSKLNLKDRKVIVPLSYSGSTNYTRLILNKGKELLGSNFYPLLDFVSNEQYSKIIANCGFLIFNHIRQQGVGNIVEMAFRGSKIFLNVKSPLISSLAEFGLKFNTIDHLNQETIDNPLSEKNILHNRKVVEKLYSLKNVVEQVRELDRTVDRVAQKKKSNI